MASEPLTESELEAADGGIAKRAVAEIRDLRARLAAAEAERDARGKVDGALTVEMLVKAGQAVTHPNFPRWHPDTQHEFMAEVLCELRRIIRDGAVAGEPGLTVAVPVCTTCNDTHVMPATGYACTHCPVPCQSCRADGNGPYCTTTPCTCACHVRRTAPADAGEER
jgi:hypothetical protein